MPIEKLKLPEDRRLEFKENLPSGNKIERTAVAFSNDAGGEIYIGIKNEPREITGIPENELIKLEEQISNIIYGNCYPAILPDILFQKIEDKYVIIIKISRGSVPPYYIKSLGKGKGTFIRVGSSNRLVDREILEELERKKRNISFDSMPVYEIKPDELDFSSFRKFYQEETGKKINKASFAKLGLIKTEYEKQYPTVSAILLSDEDNKFPYFPYAKIECVRFKGTTTDTTIDSQTIKVPVCFQADLAIKFVERNIKKGSKIGRVYREERWEYPLSAVRELIINAVIHRDYSFSGRDIRVAIYDDMLEITSPGTISPGIDLKNLRGGQSEIHNKSLGSIFKELNLIEQWGTGFKKLSDQLKVYPEIEIKFNEPGLAFQVQFIKKDYIPPATEDKLGTNLGQEEHASTPQVPHQPPLSTPPVSLQYLKNTPQAVKALQFCIEYRFRLEIQKQLGLANKKHFLTAILKPLIQNQLLIMSSPDKPNSPNQKYLITEKGRLLLEELKK
jgi:predicted HTH transcriptional regulator